MSERWKEPIIVPICKKGDKTDCSNYRGITLLSTTYKILSNILLSRLTPYADGIIGNHQSGFRRNILILLIIRVCCIYDIHEKKWKYYEAVNRLFMGLKKTYDLVRKEVSYNILIEFGIYMKPVRLINKRLLYTSGRQTFV